MARTAATAGYNLGLGNPYAARHVKEMSREPKPDPEVRGDYRTVCSFTFAQKPPKNPKTVSVYTDFPLLKVVPAMKAAMEGKGCHVTKEFPPDKFQLIKVECSREGPTGEKVKAQMSPMSRGDGATV